MSNQQDIRRIAAAFCPETEPVGIRELTSGNVNATYRLDYDPQDRSRSLVLQRINTEAFRNPEALMENIRLVTGHIRAALVAAGQDPARRVLEFLPAADGSLLHREPDGVNINDHCGSTHLDDLAAKVVAGGYDIGVAFDGDADRCLLVDEKGGIIDGDKVLAVCGSDMKRRGKLSGGTIVATVMSNLGLHEFCRKNGVGLVCTSVGDRNVLEKMNECGYKLGGEQSGHTIFTDFSTTGDGQLTALQFLDVLSRSGKKASELASVCPQYPQVLLNVPVSHERGVKDAIMASDALAAAVALQEEKLSGEGRVLVRPSGTEALIRVMVEAKTEQIALLAAENLVNVIKML